jgi:signal transduction histidine kinase
VCWTLAIVVASRGATALLVTLPLSLLPMIISLPYISRRGLISFAFGATLVCIICTALSLHEPLLPSSLDEETLSLIMLPLNIVVVGLATFGLWHVGSRLRSVLSETESINRALAESERVLEQKVTARTAELEGALWEISAIEEIARTVNVTLDLDEVIAAMRSALQRVFHFDNISVFLLDEERQSLMIDRVAGIELQLQTGISLTEEDSIVVSTFARNKSLLVPEISAETIPLMSPSDRWAHEVNPVKSVLACPLQLEQKAIGVITFARMQETMPLGAEEIERIQRYVTPLTTVIRNARLFDETRAARAEAIESSQAKSQFLANMSHELRTPLNAIIGYSEMLKEDAEEDGHQQYLDDLEKIHGSGHYLLELISGVLDLTRIEAGKIEVSLSRFDVDDLLNEVIATSRPLIMKNDNQLLEGDYSNLGQMNSDMTKVRQVLLNLLSNAAKFTDNGAIRFDVSRERGENGDWLAFRVSDEGIGMTPQQLDHVFEAFTQADNSTSRKYGGTGLGLTISKEFCEMLGGNISVESEPGRGSVFTVNLPATASNPEP